MVTSGLALAAHFGDGVLRAGDVAAGILGAVVRDPAADRRGLAGVPGDRRPGAGRLEGLLPGLPRGVAHDHCHHRGGPGGRHRAPAARGGPDEGLVLLGVRHHGPGSARAVRAALDAYRPQAVLSRARRRRTR